MKGQPATEDGGGALRKTLRRRHMSLISLGGVIGAGLFVGSGVVIHQAGPSAAVSYLLAGLITVLLMRMLAEMTVARPAVGSFYAHVRTALGGRAGFTVGWLYWYFYTIVVAVEAIAGGRLLQAWLPAVPLWALSLALLALMTATNLFSARSYGEFEYWFSSIKVAAIVVFLFLAALYVLGAWPDSTSPGLANLTGHDGFAPLGIGAMFAGTVPAIAMYTGAEIVTIAAAESVEPRRAVAKATSSIILRVLLFYVGSVFLVVLIVPWNSPDLLVSPFVAVLDRLGLPAGGQIVNAVILTAVLSCLNSSLYTSSRMLFALTGQRDAPRALTKLTRRGVPTRAILLGTSVGCVSVVAAYLSPGAVFDFLINSYGAVALFVYILVAVAHLKLRRDLERTDPESLRLKMWAYPYLSWLTLAAMVAIVVAMGLMPATRSQLLLSAATVVVVAAVYQGRQVLRRRAGRATAEPALPCTTPLASRTTQEGTSR